MALPVAAILLAQGVMASPSAAPAQMPSMHQIFDAAFRRLQSYPLPPYAIWTSTWHIDATTIGYAGQETSTVEVHRYAARMSDGMENVSGPVVAGKLPPVLIVRQFLGPFGWMLRRSVHVAPAGGVQMEPDIAGLQTIASVVAVAQLPYVADLVGVETIDGHLTYHLRLRPTSDAQRHNLRDLWIDTQTYDLRKAHFLGMYAPTPFDVPSHSDITAWFRNVLGCWVVTRAVWTYLNDVASFTFDVQYDEIGLPATLPDWLFDAAAYRRHEMAGEPDYIGGELERLRQTSRPSPSPTS
jgi:hypothetical protein